MFAVDLISFSALLIFGAVIFGLAVWFYYDRREQRLDDHRRYRTVFHCIRCGKLYSRPRKRETSVCPHCGFQNTKLKF